MIFCPPFRKQAVAGTGRAREPPLCALSGVPL